MNILLRLLLALTALLTPACRAAAPAAAAPSANAPDPLARIRAQHRLASETRARIERDLALLRASPNPDPAQVRALETYLDRVTRMEETFAAMRREMETLAGGDATAGALTADPGAGIDAAAGPGATLPDRDTIDAVAALDRELNQALSEFDRILLKENAEIGARMEEVAQANAGKLQELAQQAAEAAAAAAKVKDKGTGSGQAGEPGAEAAGENAGNPETAGKEPGEPGGEATGAETAGKGTGAMKPGEKPGDQAGDKAPGDATAGVEPGVNPADKPAGKQGGDKKVTRPGAEDDDIVARQLREAAEAETDPMLREKLWKEYDDYKKSTRR